MHVLKVNPPASLSAGFGRRTIEPAEVLAADLTGQAVVVVIATLHIQGAQKIVGRQYLYVAFMDLRFSNHF